MGENARVERLPRARDVSEGATRAIHLLRPITCEKTRVQNTYDARVSEGATAVMASNCGHRITV